MNTLLQKNTFKGRGSGRSILVVVALILINLVSAVGVKAQTGYTKLPYINTSEWTESTLPSGWTAEGYEPDYRNVGVTSSSTLSSLKLITTESNLRIQYNQTPGKIFFDARVRNSEGISTTFKGGIFIIEESVDCNTFQILETITSLPDEAAGIRLSASPSSAARVIRFRYAKQADDSNAYVALDNVSITGTGLNVREGSNFYPTGVSTYNFTETVEVGDSSKFVTFTITNAGPQTLNITGDIILSGSYARDFKIVSQPSLRVLGVEESTTFVVVFAPRNSSPTIKGSTTTLSIPNDDPNKSPYTIKLQGTAQNTQLLKISSFSPTWGPATKSATETSPEIVGTKITIKGTGFSSLFNVLFNIGENQTQIPANSTYWISSEEVQVIVPAGATTGHFRIVDENNRATTSATSFVVSDEEPLPVEFLTFEGTSTSKGVQLQWQTASETNNEYFQLESATTFKADAFKPVMQIPSKVNNSNVVVSYEALDTKPAAASTIYYRLKQVDFDGKFEYSKVIAVSNTAQLATKFKVKPNPVVENKMIVELPDANGGDLALTFTSMAGARALQQTASVEANTLEKEISLDALAPGLYIVTIEYNDQVSHQRVLKQ